MFGIFWRSNIQERRIRLETSRSWTKCVVVFCSDFLVIWRWNSVLRVPTLSVIYKGSKCPRKMPRGPSKRVPRRTQTWTSKLLRQPLLGSCCATRSCQAVGQTLELQRRAVTRHSVNNFLENNIRKCLCDVLQESKFSCIIFMSNLSWINCPIVVKVFWEL